MLSVSMLFVFMCSIQLKFKKPKRRKKVKKQALKVYIVVHRTVVRIHKSGWASYLCVVFLCML